MTLLKTELLIIGSKHQLSKVYIDSIKVSDSQIKPWVAVLNISSWVDSHMNMNVQVRKICSKTFHGLYNTRQIRKFLSPEWAKILVHALVTCHLNYWNFLLHWIPQCQTNCLQKVLISAARIHIMVLQFCSNYTGCPSIFVFNLKLPFFAYKSVNDTAPVYLKDPNTG